MKGYEEAKASTTQRTIKIQETNRQVVALRRMLLQQLGHSLKSSKRSAGTIRT